MVSRAAMVAVLQFEKTVMVTVSVLETAWRVMVRLMAVIEIGRVAMML